MPSEKPPLWRFPPGVSRPRCQDNQAPAMGLIQTWSISNGPCGLGVSGVQHLYEVEVETGLSAPGFTAYPEGDRLAHGPRSLPGHDPRLKTWRRLKSARAGGRFPGPAWGTPGSAEPWATVSGERRRWRARRGRRAKANREPRGLRMDLGDERGDLRHGARLDSRPDRKVDDLRCHGSSDRE
jgi:hypothetical protein